MNLALASTSPRRRALLEEAGIAYAAVDPGLSDAREDELARSWRSLGLGPGDVAQRLAIAKALAAEKRVPPGTTRVLAADTVVVLGDEALGKPRDLAHARDMIERLSGKTHEVLTGVALLDLATGRLEAGVESSRVRFRAIEPAALERFLASGSWAGKAGSYGVQDDAAAPLVERVEGSRSNVIGLPLERVKALLGSGFLGKVSRSTALLAALCVTVVLCGCPNQTSPPVPQPPPSPKSQPDKSLPDKPAAGDPAATGSSSPVVQAPYVPHPSEGVPQSGLPERVLEIAGKKVTVELATTADMREVGLMHRPKMDDDRGMLFVYPENGKGFHSFWMKNTLIPLTAAFIRDDGTIVNMEDMEAETVEGHRAHEGVRLVLEMNKGWFRIHGVERNALIKGAAETLPSESERVKQQRAATPLMILGFGVATIVVFGAMVWQKSDATPILKLRPVLEKEFGARGFKCWLKVNDRRIEVRPPESLPQDRASRRRLSGIALQRYSDLCDKTKISVVESAVLLAPKGSTVPAEEVSLGAAAVAHATEDEAAAIATTASVAASTSATVDYVAPGLVGAAVYLRLPPDARIGDAGARRVASQVLAAHRAVSFVHVERSDGPALEAGADVAYLASTTAGKLK